MIYITEADLYDNSYKRLIDESIGDAEDGHSVIDSNELKAIGMATTYMQGRYDTDKIFHPDNPIRNELLADIISKITLYNIFRRNAARKVTQDVKDNYDWAMKELQRINAGTSKPGGLPVPEDSSGNPISNSMWGNTSNRDNYI